MLRSHAPSKRKKATAGEASLTAPAKEPEKQTTPDGPKTNGLVVVRKKALKTAEKNVAKPPQSLFNDPIANRVKVRQADRPKLKTIENLIGFNDDDDFVESVPPPKTTKPREVQPERSRPQIAQSKEPCPTPSPRDDAKLQESLDPFNLCVYVRRLSTEEADDRLQLRDCSVRVEKLKEGEIADRLQIRDCRVVLERLAIDDCDMSQSSRIFSDIEPESEDFVVNDDAESVSSDNSDPVQDTAEIGMESQEQAKEQEEEAGEASQFIESPPVTPTTPRRKLNNPLANRSAITSFYEYPTFVGGGHGMVMSSSEEEEDVRKGEPEKPRRRITTAVLTPRSRAPTFSAVSESCAEFGIPDVRHKAVSCSRKRDAPTKGGYMSNVLLCIFARLSLCRHQHRPPDGEVGLEPRSPRIRIRHRRRPSVAERAEGRLPKKSWHIGQGRRSPILQQPQVDFGGRAEGAIQSGHHKVASDD